MSWHYSQALVEEYSEASCSAGAPSAQLSSTLTPLLYCAPDRMTAFSRLSRFGMTCAPLTEDRGAALLTWYLAGFPAKTSAQPARVQALQESGQDCGEKWRVSLARFDPASRLWRTAQHSLGADLTSCSVTWPRWGTMRAGECWALSMPVLRTNGNESGSWPTPHGFSPDGRTNGPSGNELGRAVNQSLWPSPMTTGLDGGSNSRKAAKARGMWPTPTAHPDNSNVNGKFKNPTLADAVKLWPTPTRRDYKGANSEQGLTRNDGKSRMDQLPNAVAFAPMQQIGGQLNPTWVEWLMGWPLKWTDLKPLATDKFQQWLRLHGKC